MTKSGYGDRVLINMIFENPQFDHRHFNKIILQNMIVLNVFKIIALRLPLQEETSCNFFSVRSNDKLNDRLGCPTSHR